VLEQSDVVERALPQQIRECSQRKMSDHPVAGFWREKKNEEEVTISGRQ